MKTTVKNIAKKTGLFAIDFVAAPLHIGLQLGSNVLQASADAVAMGEGYLTEKIDSTKDRELVANQRVNYTKQRFIATAEAANSIKHKIQTTYDKANDKLNNIMHKDAPATEAAAVEHTPEPGSNGTMFIGPTTV